MPNKDHRTMMTGRLAFATLTLLCLIIAPGNLPAQDAGVSGIAPGPGNVNGTNGSIRDPSGVGNAARMPALPQPSITPVVPPTVSPSVAYEGSLVQRSARPGRTRLVRYRFARSKYGHAAERAAVRENDKLLDRKLTSICKGC